MRGHWDVNITRRPLKVGVYGSSLDGCTPPFALKSPDFVPVASRGLLWYGAGEN